jgi:hypothetical protein
MMSEQDAAGAANEQQAAYLRAELELERGRLIAKIAEVESLTRNGYSTSRNIRELHAAEADLKHVEAMIDRMRQRFGSPGGAAG